MSPTRADATEEMLTASAAPEESCLSRLRQLLRQSRLQFAYGGSDPAPPDLRQIEGIAEAMRNCPAARIEIAGHTDSWGSVEDNEIMSRKRAEAILRYLVAKGVEKERLRAVGYGESRPIESNRTETGRAMNRRIEFTLWEE